MHWKLSLKRALQARCSIPDLIPSRWSDLSLADIRALPVTGITRHSTLSDWFDVDVSDSESSDVGNEISVVGDCAWLDRVGYRMADGKISMVGDCGDRVGRRMSGGTVEVHGNVGDYAASELTGGTVLIRGNAGDAFGGAVAGSERGMRGGQGIVVGSTGTRTGYRLRRGTILVGGTIGPESAAEMIAGTLVGLGAVESDCLINARRGTVVATQPIGSTSAIFSGLQAAELNYLPILWRNLQSVCAHFELDLPLPSSHKVERRVGDRAVKGLAELLIVACGTR
jgi:formylmethanofuran dehydrogenase subunit C